MGTTDHAGSKPLGESGVSRGGMEDRSCGARGYVALDILHRENLERVLDRLGIAGRFDEAERRALITAWERLPPWPDVAPGPGGARARHVSRALLERLDRHDGAALPASPGSPKDAVLGADIAKAYKPDPAVYRRPVAAPGPCPAR